MVNVNATTTVAGVLVTPMRTEADQREINALASYIGRLIAGEVIADRRRASPLVCRHPQHLWKHRHYMISERRYCALECRCGYIIDEGRVRYRGDGGLE